MSLSASLTAALSGLAAASRGAETVASNVANAQTAGYARRELALAARGPGVAVAGTIRDLDLALLGDRRRADADAAGASARAAALARIDAVFGSADDPGSLIGRIARFGGALTAAAGRPDSTIRLADLTDAAAALAAAVRTAAEAVQAARGEADRAVAADVALLNDTLAQVADLNAAIASETARGGDAATLTDQRQALIDRIAPVVPLRMVPRANGTVALFTMTGGILLDGSRPTTVGFTPAGAVTPETTVEGGALARVTLGGTAVGSGPDGFLAGGRLAANLALRDADGPAVQDELDALARDLIERFSAPAADPTLPPGDPGVFTDAGLAFDIGRERGLAQRLALNALVDPDAGGDPSRWRDGLGAASPGDPGAADQLLRLADTFAERRATGSAALPAGLRSVTGLGAAVASAAAARRIAAEDASAFAAARGTALRDAEAARGIDTDRELQDLLRIERAYAANAQVVATVDRMLEILLGVQG